MYKVQCHRAQPELSACLELRLASPTKTHQVLSKLQSPTVPKLTSRNLRHTFWAGTACARPVYHCSITNLESKSKKFKKNIKKKLKSNLIIYWLLLSQVLVLSMLEPAWPFPSPNLPGMCKWLNTSCPGSWAAASSIQPGPLLHSACSGLASASTLAFWPTALLQRQRLQFEYSRAPRKFNLNAVLRKFKFKFAAKLIPGISSLNVLPQLSKKLKFKNKSEI